MEREYSIVKASAEDLGKLKEIRLQIERHLASRNKYLWSITEEKKSTLEDAYRKMLGEDTTRILLVREDEGDEIVGLGIGTIKDNEGLIGDHFSGRLLLPRDRRRAAPFYVRG